MDDERGRWLDKRLEGPLLNIGAGVGRDALYFQQPFEAVAIETSDALIETMRNWGVVDARGADMFDLASILDDDRFGRRSPMEPSSGS